MRKQSPSSNTAQISKEKYYRNTEPINGVEAQALWKVDRACFVLVDQDRYVHVLRNENEDKFYEVYISAEAEKHL